MNPKRTAVVMGIVCLLTVPARAHHAFSAEFDVDKPLTLKGTLTKIEWVNPHAWLHVDVMEPDGKIVSWSIETGGPNQLMKRGLRITSFPIGVEVIVTGYRAKKPESMTANGMKVKFSDGRDFFLASSGNGAPPVAADQESR
jgi:hypothetical protein